MIDDSELGDGAGYAGTDRRTLRSRKVDCIDLLGDNNNVATSKAGSVAHFEAETVVEILPREIARKAPLAIAEGDPLGKAIGLIDRNKVKRLIVTDDAGRLCGIVAPVFLESYLAAFVATHDRYDIAKFRDIPAMMAKKMSACGRAAALTRETRAARTRAADRGRDGGSGRRLVAVTVHRSALSGSPMPLSRGASACQDDACMDAASEP